MDHLFEQTSIKKAYFTLALPVVLSMLVNLIYNMVDTFFVSQTQNPALVAGVSQSAPVFTFLIALGDIFGLGGSSVISRLFGNKQFTTGRNVSGFAFYGALFTGIVTAIILLIAKNPVLHLLGASTTTWQYANQYYTILVLGAPAIVFSLAPSNILRTEGLAVASMKASVLGTVINIILDPIFISSFHWGAAGAAGATVISQVISALMLAYYTGVKSQRLTVSLHETHISRSLQREILAIGIPASITNIMITFATAVTNNFLIQYGAGNVAAMGIATKISMIINLIFVGFAFGAQPLIGYTYGAKDAQRFHAVVKFDLQVIISFSLLMTLVIWLLAPWLMSQFLHDPVIIAKGTTMIRWLVSSSVFAGLILVFTTIFQSLGKAQPAGWLSISRQGLIFVIVIVVAHALFGYQGVIMAQCLSDILTALLALFFWFKYQPKF